MRLLSQVFQPLITIPKNAKIKSTEITCKSQKLLVECGLIRPTSSGLFTILPLARRALDKLEALIRNCIEGAGGQKMSLPALTAASLWKSSGRLDDAGPELMQFTDRHNKQYLLAPTHEEAIADLIADVGPLSYKQLPLLLYQISNKYRDEHRPKHGLLRAREFTMMDAYGVHADEGCARAVYSRLDAAYRRLFKLLRANVYRVEAPGGQMGGSLSHEWQLPAPSGEDALHVCPRCARAALAPPACRCGAPAGLTPSAEVGHTFVLGTRYSEPLKGLVATRDGAAPAVMSCYGIGVTRLMAACLEATSTETELRWPRLIAPYSAVVVGPKEGSKEWSGHGWSEIENVYRTLSQVTSLKDDILIDDRHSMTIGKRVMQANRMGYPFIVVCGKSSINNPPSYELITSSDEPKIMSLQEICAVIENKSQEENIDNISAQSL